MKLHELIEPIGDDVKICIDSKECEADLLDYLLGLEIKSIDIKTDKQRETLENLGYSFEVGV